MPAQPRTHGKAHAVSSRRSPSPQQESSCDRLLSPGTNLHPAPSPWRPGGNSPAAAPTRRPHTRQLPPRQPRPSSAPAGTPPAIPAPLPPGSRATLRARGAPARSARAAPPRPVSHPARERVAGGGAARGRGWPEPLTVAAGRARRAGRGGCPRRRSAAGGGGGHSAGAGASGQALPGCPRPASAALPGAHWRGGGGASDLIGFCTHPSRRRWRRRGTCPLDWL